MLFWWYVDYKQFLFRLVHHYMASWNPWVKKRFLPAGFHVANFSRISFLRHTRQAKQERDYS